MKRAAILSVVAVLLATTGISQAQQRDTISVVGSSTVYPFSTVVAEKVGKAGGFKTPKIESTGTGGGFKLFCSGVGVQHPDITNASRAIKASEFESCQKNGVTDIVEVKIGYDGIVFGQLQEGRAAEADDQGNLPGAGQGGARPQGRGSPGAQSLQELEGSQRIGSGP